MGPVKDFGKGIVEVDAFDNEMVKEVSFRKDKQLVLMLVAPAVSVGGHSLAPCSFLCLSGTLHRSTALGLGFSYRLPVLSCYFLLANGCYRFASLASGITSFQ